MAITPTTQLGTPGEALRDASGNIIGGYDSAGGMFRFGTLPPSSSTPPSSADARILPEPKLPTPAAPTVMEGYVGSLTDNVANQRKAVEDAYKRQLEDVERQQKEAQSKIDEFTKKQENIIETDMEENLKPFREQLENNERNRLSINENFEANQSLVRELETLLTQSNNMMNQLRGSKIPGLAGISQSPRAIQALQDVSARVGVIQAVMNARSGQIAEGYRMIDRSLEAVNADRQDQLNYYSTIFDFYENQKDEEGKKLFQLNNEEKSWINKQIGMLENDLASSQATADYIKEMMINPETAKFMADSGVTMNDSVETIQNKMAKQAKVIEDQKKFALNKQEAFDAGITTQFYDKGGTWVRTADGMEFESPEQFKQMTGMSLEEARAAGMVTDYNMNMIAEKNQVMSIMEKYWDAGIKPTDSIDVAVQKAKASAIYQDSIRPPGSGSGPGDDEGSAGLFGSFIDEGLIAGLSPEDAVLDAIAYADSMGISIGAKERKGLLDYARSRQGIVGTGEGGGEQGGEGEQQNYQSEMPEGFGGKILYNMRPDRVVKNAWNGAKDIARQISDSFR